MPYRTTKKIRTLETIARLDKKIFKNCQIKNIYIYIYILIHNYYTLIAYVIYCMFCTTMKLAIDETPQYVGLTT